MFHVNYTVDDLREPHRQGNFSIGQLFLMYDNPAILSISPADDCDVWQLVTEARDLAIGLDSHDSHWGFLMYLKQYLPSLHGDDGGMFNGSNIIQSRLATKKQYADCPNPDVIQSAFSYLKNTYFSEPKCSSIWSKKGGHTQFYKHSNYYLVLNDIPNDDDIFLDHLLSMSNIRATVTSSSDTKPVLGPIHSDGWYYSSEITFK